MAEVSAGVAIFSAIFGAASTIKSQRDQRKYARQAQAEERKQRALANRQQALERRRSIRQSIAQSRVLQAQAASFGFAGSGGGQTSFASGMGSASAIDTGLAIGASNTQFATASAIAESQNRQSAAMQAFEDAKTNWMGGVAQFAGAFANADTLRGLEGAWNRFNTPVVDTTTPLFGRAR